MGKAGGGEGDGTAGQAAERESEGEGGREREGEGGRESEGEGEGGVIEEEGVRWVVLISISV